MNPGDDPIQSFLWLFGGSMVLFAAMVWIGTRKPGGQDE